ncbi:hypothetical protein L3Q82_018969, partial [Scortum barcoo]
SIFPSRHHLEVRRMSRVEGLKANSSRFTLEGRPFRVLGGSIHYFRVPRAYWEDRLLKMKACGLNTLTTYVPWNLHEPERGAFNFQDQLDLKAYVSLAAEMGLWVILRPGPYICAEWDLGGLPSWLLQDKGMQLRTTYPGFVDAVNLYFNKLVSVIKPLMFEEGGPIIAVQVENEYGSYAKDEEYMPFIKNCLESRGIKELLLTSDNWEGLRHGGLEGVLRTINLQRLSFGAIQHLADMQPQKPLMVMEYWSGWFDAWGEHHHVFHAEDMLAVVSEILERGVSINLYMFHGGTSFGFMNGANRLWHLQTSGHQLWLILTVFANVFTADYDAPLSEAGDCTPKYHLLRNLFSQYHSEPLPEVPSSLERRAYDPVVIQRHLSLWDSLHFADKPYRSERPVNMENLPVNNNNGQSYGYTLYETTIPRGGTLSSRNNIRDRALVFVDRQCVGILDYKNHELTLPDGKGEMTLSLLVENCGRVNYGKTLDEQRKGNLYSIHSSIHFQPLDPGPGRGGSSLSRDAQTSLTPDTSSSSSGGTPRRSQASQPERHSLSSVSWVFPEGLLPVGHAWNTSLGRRDRGHPKLMPKPPQLTPLNVKEQRLYSELLPSDRASHPISKGSASHPAEETHFGCLSIRSCPFGHYPKFMTIGIVGDILLNQTPLRGFSAFCLDMKPNFMKRLMSSGQWKSDFKSPFLPGFFQAKLHVDAPPRDTFIRLPGWGKGVVFVNGQNLGRHWSIGPQLFLYLPGAWLRGGENQPSRAELQDWEQPGAGRGVRCIPAEF